MSEHTVSRRDALLNLGSVGTGAVLAVGALASAPAHASGGTYYPPGNILNFGADPTGSADSSPAFAAAITALWNSAEGCALYVPSGKYKIKQPIVLKTKIKLYGDGFSSVIQCAFDGSTVVPNVTAVAAGVSLAYAPMVCNTGHISWWSIQDLQFDGLNGNAYGAWFADAAHGNMRNVYFLNLGKRPYTILNSTFTDHHHLAFYNCGDGVLCSNCQGFSFDTLGLDRIGGAYSFQWRAASAGYGPLDMRNVWCENSPERYNTIGYLGLGGYHIFVRTILASSNGNPNPNLRAIHLFDNGDTLNVDNVNLTSTTAHGVDIGQIADYQNFYYYIPTGSVGNALSGHINLAKVIGGGVIAKGSGWSVNGTIQPPVAPASNTVVSLS